MVIDRCSLFPLSSELGPSCRRKFTPKRFDERYCSLACKQAASRWRLAASAKLIGEIYVNLNSDRGGTKDWTGLCSFLTLSSAEAVSRCAPPGGNSSLFRLACAPGSKTGGLFF